MGRVGRGMGAPCGGGGHGTGSRIGILGGTGDTGAMWKGGKGGWGALGGGSWVTGEGHEGEGGTVRGHGDTGGGSWGWGVAGVTGEDMGGGERGMRGPVGGHGDTGGVWGPWGGTWWGAEGYGEHWGGGGGACGHQGARGHLGGGHWGTPGRARCDMGTLGGGRRPPRPYNNTHPIPLPWSQLLASPPLTTRRHLPTAPPPIGWAARDQWELPVLLERGGASPRGGAVKATPSTKMAAEPASARRAACPQLGTASRPAARVIGGEEAGGRCYWRRRRPGVKPRRGPGFGGGGGGNGGSVRGRGGVGDYFVRVALREGGGCQPWRVWWCRVSRGGGGHTLSGGGLFW